MKTCFIVAPQNIHWVLDRIAHEIGERMEGEVTYCYDLQNIPEADTYFVTHYSLVPSVLMKANPATHRIICFFTHESVPVSSLVDVLNLCHAIVCENQVELRRLISYGINPNLLHFVPEGGDPIRFRPHHRTGKGAILISSACYPRKNPSLVMQIMGLMPQREFVIVGKGWPNILLDNVTYHDSVDYSEYPEIYSKCDVFLSCATLEGGGPGGLIEAMHSNLYPVVSDTGNAREYIISGYNGFTMPLDSKAEDYVKAIEEAYKAEPQETIPYNDVWQTVQSYTWDNYASQMKEIILDTSRITVSDEA